MLTAVFGRLIQLAPELELRFAAAAGLGWKRKLPGAIKQYSSHLLKG